MKVQYEETFLCTKFLLYILHINKYTILFLYFFFDPFDILINFDVDNSLWIDIFCKNSTLEFGSKENEK